MSLTDEFSKDHKVPIKTLDTSNMLVRLFSPPDAVLKSKAHTRKILDGAELQFMKSAMDRSTTNREPNNLEMMDMDLRSDRLKALTVLRLQYFYLADNIVANKNALSILLWGQSNLERLLPRNFQSDDSTNVMDDHHYHVTLVPFMAPDPVIPTQEQELSRLRKGLDVDVWVGPPEQALRFMAPGSMGTDNTRYGHPKAADLMDLNFGAARVKKLNRQADRLLTSGWWRLGKFDLRADDNNSTRPNLLEQVRIAKEELMNLKSTVSLVRASIVQLEIEATQIGCQHVTRAVHNVFKRHKDLLSIS